MSKAQLLALFACLILAGCSGGSQPGPPAGSNPEPAGQGVTATLLRGSSGAPSGIRVSWDPIPDVAGYNLYRMATPIPDSERGKPDNRVNSEPIPQASAPEKVVYDDLFPCEVGEEWHYRISAVDDTGDEGDLSPESSLIITDFIVTRLVTTQAGVGDEVIIEGENFGTYEPLSDAVHFPGVVSVIGTGVVPAMHKASIVSWTNTSIVCRVPNGTTVGTVRVSTQGLSQVTPETFTNTDPYITAITPLEGYNPTQVTLTGANFGSGPGSSDGVRVDGTLLGTGNYDAYSDTQIIFHLEGATPKLEYAIHLAHVERSGRSSNSAHFTLLNRPPTARFTVTPVSGETPLTVILDCTSSSDPDGDSITYAEWDTDGDGIFDLYGGIFPFNWMYQRSGRHTISVKVFDGHSFSEPVSQEINVTLSDLKLSDNGTFPAGTEFFQSDSTVPVRFTLSGGEPVYSIDWYLEDTQRRTEVLLVTDSNVSYGDNIRRFPIDTTTTQPVPGSGKIPAGQWRIRGEAHDGGAGNDPDPVEQWPKDAEGKPQSFRVYRYDVFVMQDAEGDPDYVESDAIIEALQTMNYKVSSGFSGKVEPSEIAGRQVVVWAADGPHGKLPYDWLSVNDLALAKTYVDGGGSLLIMGAPATEGDPFSQDADFSQNYQPLSTVKLREGPVSALAVYTFWVDSFDVGTSVGFAELADIHNPFGGGYASEAFMVQSDGDYEYMSLTARGGDRAVTLCMFSLSAVSNVQPVGRQPRDLLDALMFSAVSLSDE